MPYILFLFILISSLLFTDFARSLCVSLLHFIFLKKRPYFKRSYAMEYRALFDIRSHVSATICSNNTNICEVCVFNAVSLLYDASVCCCSCCFFVGFFRLFSIALHFLLISGVIVLSIFFFSHLTSRSFFPRQHMHLDFFCILPIFAVGPSCHEEKKIEFVHKHCWAARSVECARTAKWCIALNSFRLRINGLKEKIWTKIYNSHQTISFGAWVFLLMLLHFHSRCFFTWVFCYIA